MQAEVRGLVNLCLEGDEAAIQELVERHQGRVYGLCYRMVGQRQDAEDLTQETFVRALRNLARWDASRDFEPWLLAIAGNRCRTLLAKRQRRPSVATLAEPVVDPRPNLESARSLSEEVGRALGQLRDEYRQAFLLFHEQQLSYAEIAAVFDCPLGTVKTWVHRARRELGAKLHGREVVRETGHVVRKV